MFARVVALLSWVLPLFISSNESPAQLAGREDPTFSASASGSLGGYSGVNRILVGPDGKILVCGFFSQMNGQARPGLARLLPTGALDSSFTYGEGPDEGVLCVAAQEDGMIVVGGEFTRFHGLQRTRLARLHPNGTLDRAFDPWISSIVAVTAVWDLAVQPDGRILIGGVFTDVQGLTRLCIARINADGSADSTFAPAPGANNLVLAVRVQPDDKLLLGGAFKKMNGVDQPNLARLLSNGASDPSFATGSGPDGWVWSLAVQPDRQILIGGSFTNYNGTLRPNLARLTETGALDTTFDAGAFSPSAAEVACLALQKDGRIVAGGSFRTVRGQSRSGLARFFADGALDETFQIGTGFDEAPITLAVQSDGRILVGGYFSTFDGRDRGGIVRLMPDANIPAVRLLAPVYDTSAQSFAFSFGSTTGVTYHVEAADSLLNPNWVVVTNLLGTGANRIARDPSSTSVQRFYRVRAP